MSLPYAGAFLIVACVMFLVGYLLGASEADAQRRAAETDAAWWREEAERLRARIIKGGRWL
jgi:hypothetical protein